MSSTHPIPTARPDLITLELGDTCYGATVLAYEHELGFEPLPAGVPQPDSVCGLIRLGDSPAVPVFDLRTSGGKSGGHRLLVASGYHGEDCPVAMAFLIDAAARPSLHRRNPVRFRATASVRQPLPLN